MSILLLLLLLIPLFGAIVCAILPSASLAKSWALLVSLATLGVAIVLGFTRGETPVTYAPAGWSASGFNFAFRLSCDSISFWLVLLTTGLQPLAIAASFASIKERERQYYAWMLALLVAMLGVFISQDVLLFYVFFELTLIPMFFIIGLWGGPERRYAAGKFFLFTFAGSVFTLAAAVYLGMRAGSFDISTCVYFAQTAMTDTERFWLFLGFLAGFAVKVPLFPVHTWLPLAHTEAPTAGSVILAGVLLKLGTYGVLRLAVPIGLVGAETAHWFPTLIWWIGLLCVVGVVYGALVAWVQQDIKKLVAYSSVSHLGFCVLGLLALNQIGIQGSILYMINHGISTGAMFLVIGMIYDRFHTRDINALSGLARRMPVMACFFVFFVLSSIGLPGLNGFWSEFLTILGAFTSTHLGITFGAVAATGIVLGAIYMLHMTAKVIFGPLKYPHMDDHGDGHGHGEHAAKDHGTELPRDLSGREVAILVPLALAAIILGVYPRLISDDVAQGVQDIRTAALVAPRTPVPGPASPADANVAVVVPQITNNGPQISEH